MDVSAIPNNFSAESATARNLVADNQTTLWSAISDRTQVAIAEAIGHDKSFVNRFMSKRPPDNPPKINVDEMLKMLEAAGLVLVRESDLEHSVIIQKDAYRNLLDESIQWRGHVKSQI